jgi:hypothetical protein
MAERDSTDAAGNQENDENGPGGDQKEGHRNDEATHFSRPRKLDLLVINLNFR